MGGRGGVINFRGICGGSNLVPTKKEFSVWILKENARAINYEPHECVIFAKSTKIGTHENKAIHSIENFALIWHLSLLRASVFHKHILLLSSFQEGGLTALLTHNNRMDPETLIDVLAFAASHGYVISSDGMLTGDKLPPQYSKCDKLIHWVKKHKDNVASLSDISRIFLRHRFIHSSGGTSIVPLIESLPLPQLLKDFVKFEGEKCEMEITRRMLWNQGGWMYSVHSFFAFTTVVEEFYQV